MTTDELQFSVCDGVGHIMLNRPHRRNALTFAMYDEIGRICRAISAGDRPEINVLMISGGGDKAFAAGTDISQFRTFSAADAAEYEEMINRVLTDIEQCPVPTIALLNGFCTGGGAMIAATTDIRIASKDMQLGAPIARTLGNCLAIANLRRLVRLVGEARVKYMLLTAQLIDADAAATAGFVSEILPDQAALMARGNELAQMMAGMAPLTLRATKEGLRRLQLATPLPDDHDLIALCFGSADFKEGIDAFFDKRRPDWQGR